MIVLGGYGLGDELMLTAWVRGYHRARPQENIRLFNHRLYLWQGCPWINVGNEENGLTVDPLKSGWAVAMGHFPRSTARDFGFVLEDPTPEIFLTPEELAVEYWPPTSRPVVAVDPAAGWASRRWVAGRWQDVCSALLDRGYAVVEVGAENGTPRPLLPHTWSLFDRLTVRETAVALKRADLYLGMDSGLFHLAAAVGTPQAVIFGPVRAMDRAYPTTVALEAPSACPMLCREACSTPMAGEARCTSQIAAGDVLEAAERILEARKGVGA